jgi:two-component system, cell cycle sensor histidine kinase and response regulator CckA
MKLDNESIFREILEQSLAGYWDWDIPSGNEYMSPAFKKMFGYEDHEIPNRADSWRKLVFPEDLPGVLEKIDAHIKSKGAVPYYHEVRYRHKNGSTVWVICTGKVIEWDAAGGASRMIGCHVDITERKRIEEAFHEKNETLALFIEHAPAAIAMFDRDMCYVAVSQRWIKDFRLEGIGLIGKSHYEIFPEIPQDLKDIHRRGMDGETVKGNDEKFERDDGTVQWLRWEMWPWKTWSGPVGGIVIFSEDVTERLEAVEAVSISEKQLRAYFEGAGDAIYVLEKETGRIVNCNAAACRSLGYGRNELLALSVRDIEARLSQGEIYETLHKAAPAQTLTVEGTHKRKDNTVFPVEIRLSPLDFGKLPLLLAIVRDISERKRMEEELQKSQKLDSLGLLAGGIAHDFNNLLGGIFGYLDLAAGTAHTTQAAEYLTKALSTIERARGLTRQLLTFAKGGAPIKKLERLVPFIGETAQFALSGSNVSLRLIVPPSLWPCEIDRNQIGQVIDNFVINAQQAMPEGGVIEVTAENIHLETKAHPALPGGDFVKIAVRDHGIGMPKEILPKIFDPFFTTKAKGHGLGLATCYSIVKRHGGSIDVESEPGKGSTFTFYLPASPEAATSDYGIGTALHCGTGSILVMDDEEVIRDAVSSMLKAMGYNVHCVPNAKEAIEAVESRGKESFAALILDLTIPGGPGGKETIREIRKFDNDVRAFVASGYADDPVMANPANFGFTASIRKPFVKSELAELLNKHLRKAP